MERKRSFRFGKFSPDFPRFDTGDLADAKNLVPLYGSYRMVRRQPAITVESGWGAPDIDGIITHLVTELRTEEGIRPNSDVDAEGWATFREQSDAAQSRYDSDAGESQSDGDLWDAIDELQASTSDYIQSLGAPSGVDCVIAFEDPTSSPDANLADNEVTFRMEYGIQGSDGSTWTLNVAGSDDGFSTTLFSEDITGTADVPWKGYNYPLNETGGDTIDNVDWDNFSVRFTATVPGNGATEFKPTYSADRDRRTDDGWVTGGGLTGLQNLILAIDDDDSVADGTKDATEIKSPLPSNGGKVSIKIPIAHALAYDPWTQGTWTMKLRAARATGADSGVTMQVALYNGDTEITSHDHGTLTMSFADYDHNLTTAEVESIDDQSDLYMLITMTHPGGGVGSNDKLRVSFAQVQAPDVAGARVSWAFLALPLPGSEQVYVGDEEQIFVGKETLIWQANDEDRGFTDVTRASGNYGSGNTRHTAWDFCSFGNNVIATNLADPVQVKAPTDTNFDDLIQNLYDSTGANVGPGGADTATPPQAKFCATIGPHLFLGNVDYTNGSIVGSASGLWWSAFNDPETFAESFYPAGQANVLDLVQTPGQITGLIGGDLRGYAFKQNAIHALTYTGDDLVFVNQVIARDIGTLYPKSIVSVGNDVYFFSQSGFAVIRNGQSVELIGRDVQKFIMDQEHSLYAMASATQSDSKFRDNNIIGTYDANTGLILWMYRDIENKSEKLYKSVGLFYNVFEDRWTHLRSPTLDISQITPRYNNDSPTALRGIQMVEKIALGGNNYKGQVRFEDTSMFACRIATHILSAKSFGLEPGSEITIKGVRLINQQEEEPIPAASNITVRAWQQPTARLDDAVQSKETYHEVNRDGWVPVSVTGEYFEFIFNLQDVVDDNVILDGFEVKYYYQGEETR